MTLPYGETVTRIRATPGGYDQYGDPLPGTTSELEIPGCALAPRYSHEQTEPGRRAVIEGLTLFTPPGADILPGDNVTARGIRYLVDGEPGDWRSPYTGINRGVEITLRRASEGTA